MIEASEHLASLVLFILFCILNCKNFKLLFYSYKFVIEQLYLRSNLVFMNFKTAYEKQEDALNS